MSALSQFGGRQPTKSIVNFYSAGGISQPNVTTGRVILSGALTADTPKTLLTISAPGSMPNLEIHAVDSTSRTLRIKVTVDGVVAFDATSNAITSANQGVVVASGYPIVWNSSIVIEVASSLSETDKVAIGYVAHT